MQELHNTLIFIPLVQLALAIARMANFFPRSFFESLFMTGIKEH